MCMDSSVMLVKERIYRYNFAGKTVVLRFGCLRERCVCERENMYVYV